MKTLKLSLVVCSAVALFFSCQKEDQVSQPVHTPKLPATAYDYVAGLNNAPAWYVMSKPSENPLTNDGATLGRVLFYDKVLSLNNSIACASCHSAQFGFADDRSFSFGFQSQVTARNAMAIVNPGLASAYFWDTRVNVLEDMVLRPIRNHIEMGIEDIDNLVIKLGMESYYPPLFDKAFGSPDITQDRIGKALAQFLRSMVTYNTRYDEGKTRNFSNFSAAEEHGRFLFFNVLPCGRCHDADRLGGKGLTANVGLDIDYTDNGLMDVTEDAPDEGHFKIPSLRNVALTAPYMHDGRFGTLEAVIRFYNDKIEPNPNLSFPLSKNVVIFHDNGYGDPSTSVSQPQPPEPLKFNLNNKDVADIVAFLNTLTDYDFITDKKFMDPFE